MVRERESESEDTVGSDSVVTVVGKRPTSSKERVLSMSRSAMGGNEEKGGKKKKGREGKKRRREEGKEGEKQKARTSE
jgi:hypothetical protein